VTWLEQRRYAGWPRSAATGRQGVVITVGVERFEQMVDEALDGLPPALGRAMRNVAVVVEDGDDPHLLGLYQGVPLTERNSDYSAVLPDKITIFRAAICARCVTEAEVVDEVRTTVAHEIGHHFGIDDERLHELGW
jgi:predicted Zn-dependent protease with MMP-like domain